VHADNLSARNSILVWSPRHQSRLEDIGCLARDEAQLHALRLAALRMPVGSDASFRFQDFVSNILYPYSAS
jgi:hypothetical protein